MNKMIYLGLLFLLLGATHSRAQVTIGVDALPRTGAGLDLRTDNRGLLLPKVELDADPTVFVLSGDPTTAAGMMVYNQADVLNGKGLYVWNGTNWNRLCPGAPTISTTDTYSFTVSKDAIQPTLSVSADGNGDANLSYLWQSSSTGSDPWSTASGTSTNANYFAPTTAAGTTYYRCQVANACGTTNTANYTVTVRDCSAPPAITATTADETKITKQGVALPADLQVTATGLGTLTYLWEKSTDLTGWEEITDATSSSYTAPVNIGNTFYYRCVVSNACGSVTSKIFTVNVCGTEKLLYDVKNNWYCTGDFGTAGTWMTMNLRSKQYADNTALTSKQGISANDAADVYYWYPNQATSVEETTADDILEQHPEYGLLYTWAAATRRSTTGDNEGNKSDQAQYQGICPTGWHLPSDYEWNQLEKAITESAAYSTEGAVDTWTESWSTAAGSYRGTHGKKMKSATKVTATDPVGKSKGLAANGFDAPLVGSVMSDNPRDYGASATFWSSSSRNSGGGYARRATDSRDGIHLSTLYKHILYNVRCKKN